MTNILVLFCCITAGLLVGIFLKRRAVRKNLFWRDLSEYADALKLNVVGRQLEIKKFNDEFCLNACAVFAEAVNSQNFSVLNARQTDTVRRFFNSLDCSGGEALLQHLQFYQKIFHVEFEASAEEVKKSSLYIKLGLLAGVSAGILFL